MVGSVVIFLNFLNKFDDHVLAYLPFWLFKKIILSFLKNFHYEKQLGRFNKIWCCTSKQLLHTHKTYTPNTTKSWSKIQNSKISHTQILHSKHKITNVRMRNEKKMFDSVLKDLTSVLSPKYTLLFSTKCPSVPSPILMNKKLFIQFFRIKSNIKITSSWAHAITNN